MCYKEWYEFYSKARFSTNYEAKFESFCVNGCIVNEK